LAACLAVGFLEDDARFFLAAIRTSSGKAGGDTPMIARRVSAGAFYGGLVIAPRRASR
jgi:hypothetical protein